MDHDGTGSNVQAAIYTRISIAVLGDTTKTDEQERLCRELCQRRGWPITEVYTDLSKSAWKRDRKREGWDSMLADVKAGKVNAIVTYWGDRIVRQPRDLEDLLDLREGRRIVMASVGGQYDFDNPDHRMMMRWEVARACNESDTISRRRIQEHERMRREGRVRSGGRGGRAFGFATDGVTHVPDECEIVREAAVRVLGGEGIGAICRDLTGRGIITTTGIPFGHGTLRKLLARPRYAGLMPDGISAAAWQPVIDRTMWEAVRAILSDRSTAFGYATNARRHLLSGIIECEACGTPMRYKPSKGKGSGHYQQGYGCVQPGCRKVWRDQKLLDAYVGRRTVNRLNDPRNPEPRAPELPGLASEFAALTQALCEVDNALADHTRGAVPALMARREGIERRLGELRELAAGDAAVRLRAAHAGISQEEFDGLPLHVRRSLVGACFKVVVLPASKRGPGFRSEDVQLSPL